jgi:Fic family protein
MFRPTYHLTTHILKDVAAIEAAKEVIFNARLVPAWERQFREEALVRQVFHSTHIEGNNVNLSQAKMIIDGNATSVVARDRDIQEILNYRNVIKYINKYHIPTINKTALLHIHSLIVEKILPDSQAGVYREVQVAIINNLTNSIVFKPPPAEQVSNMIDGYFAWLELEDTIDLPAPLKAGLSHYELVRIHPFIDGNGRTARVMAMLLLYRDGYDMKQFFCLDEYYDHDSASYYAALQSANETGDLTRWLEYFIHGLAIEFTRIKERVLELSRDHTLRAKLGQIALSDRQATILKYLEEYERIANADWKTLLPNVSDDTILRDIKDMIKKKLIKKKGKTKAAVYVLR